MYPEDFVVIACFIVLLSCVVGMGINNSSHLSFLKKGLLYAFIATPTALFIGVTKPADMGYMFREGSILIFLSFCEQSLWHKILIDRFGQIYGSYEVSLLSQVMIKKHITLAIIVLALVVTVSHLSLVTVTLTAVLGLIIGSIRCYVLHDTEYWESLIEAVKL